MIQYKSYNKNIELKNFIHYINPNFQQNPFIFGEFIFGEFFRPLPPLTNLTKDYFQEIHKRRNIENWHLEPNINIYNINPIDSILPEDVLNEKKPLKRILRSSKRNKQFFKRSLERTKQKSLL